MPPAPTAPQKRILIVEDDAFLQTLLSTGLAHGPYELAVARNTEEALQSIHEQRPDLLVLDLLLPDSNGLDFASKLGQGEATKGIPFIIFSNIDDPASRKKSEELGAVHYFVKAMSTPSELLEYVNGYFLSHP